MKKLFELKTGDRFEFIDKHRGKTFEVKNRTLHSLTYVDIATQEERTAKSNRVMFRKEVMLLESSLTRAKDLTLYSEEIDMLAEALQLMYKVSAEDGEPDEVRSRINRLWLKVTK